MSIQLSNRTAPMLETMFSTDYMSIDEAQHFDQRPFRALLVREYVAYKPGKGFFLTEKGREARRVFYDTDITRRDPRGPLTRFFDPVAYGLAPRKKAQKKASANVHELPAKGAA